jgi:alpha-amylase
MPSVCLYFQVHQPLRLRHYTFFDIDHNHAYEDEDKNRLILNEVAEKCYLPANRIMLNLIKRYRGDFRISYSISGAVIDQLEKYRMDVLDTFKRLADTGCVEFLNETYNHALAFLFSVREFREQVMLHKEKVKSLFGQTAKTFRYTELIYNNDLARAVEKMGYRVILAEGADKVLGWRSPNYVYQPAGCDKLKLLVRNHRLSDDVAFRFSNTKWSEYPLMADKYARWIHHIHEDGGAVVNLFMDYETFGEHQWQETGIFEFIKMLPREIIKHPEFRFQTLCEAAQEHNPVAQLDVPEFISWADTDRDLSDWLGNSLQEDAIHTLYAMEPQIRRRKDVNLLRTWRTLQTSDHFYYMCTKYFPDGDVHKYFNPYASPYDAYINYMNILDDFSGLIGRGKRRSVLGETARS